MASESSRLGSELPDIIGAPTNIPPKLTFLGKPGGQYAVRLVNPLFDSPNRRYFDEYEKLGDPNPPKHATSSEKYIIPEDTTYAIEFILKKGFDFREYCCIFLRIYDIASKVELGQKIIPKNTKGNSLDEDKPYLVDLLDFSTVNGERSDGAAPSLHELANDENLSNETDVPSISPRGLGGVHVQLQKCTEGKLGYIDEETYKTHVKMYEARLKPLPSKVDEKTWNKHGITHRTGMLGGEKKGAWGYPRRKCTLTAWADRIDVFYFCRSKDFIQRDENKLFRSPIPMECFPWDSLKEYERAAGFKALQAYDKEQTLQQVIAEAGPGADIKSIQRELLELGEIPNRWRGWGSFYKREREGLFRELQMRRIWFEKGEYPPNSRLPGNSEKTAHDLGWDKVPRGKVKKEELDAAKSAMSGDKIKIKDEPAESPEVPRNSSIKQAVVILDDSDDGVPKPRGIKRQPSRSSPVKRPTIKTEPIDLDAPSPPKSDIGVAKKIKLEPNERPKFPQRAKSPEVPEISEPPKIEDGPELLRLKEEDEREEEELLAAQRVQELIRQRNERKKRIAALEARNCPALTPGRNARD